MLCGCEQVDTGPWSCPISGFAINCVEISGTAGRTFLRLADVESLRKRSTDTGSICNISLREFPPQQILE